MEGQGDFLRTVNVPWALLRAAAAEDAAAALDPASVNLDASVQSGLLDVHSLLGYLANGVELAAFTPSDAAGDTFGLELWANRDGGYGPGVMVFTTGTTGCVIGTAKCALHPISGAAQADGLWCHMVDITDRWGGVSVLDYEQNGICRLKWDLRGYRYLKPHVFAADGSGTECGLVGLVISGY